MRRVSKLHATALFAAAAVLALALPAAGATASPARADAAALTLPPALCEVAEGIDRIHTLSELDKWISGDFELSSAFLLVGIWGAEHAVCPDAAREAHNILLNGVQDPVFDELLHDMRSFRLPAVPHVPTAHIAFPTVSIAQHASGNSLAGAMVPLSIQWLQWGSGLSSVGLSVTMDGRTLPYYPVIDTVARRGGLLRLTPRAWRFPGGHRYDVCLTVAPLGGSPQTVCAQPFAVWKSANGVGLLDARLASAAATYWVSPPGEPASTQIGVVSSGGGARVADEAFLYQAPRAAFCRSVPCVAWTTPTLASGWHTLYFQGWPSGPLHADYLLYLQAE